METSTHWQVAREVAERYQRIVVPSILGPAARALVEWSDLRTDETVVDIGCGTGAAARFAAEKVGPAGRVVGVDVNAAMIEVARSEPPAAGAPIEWAKKSAHELPLRDKTCDVALCAQALQFVTDHARAVSEMYRVLKPGGRVAISVWCEIRESPYLDALVDAVSTHIGKDTAAGLGVAFDLSNPEEVGALLADCGFAEPKMVVSELRLALPRLSEFVSRHVSATPMAAGFSAAPDAAKRAVVQQVTERLAAYDTGAGVCVPFRTHLVKAKK